MKLLYILSEYLPDSGGGIITHYSRILPRLVERGHSVKVILASAGKLDQPAYKVEGVHVEPLRSSCLEKYKGCFERWAGLDIFYYMLPVAWAAWEQALEGFDYDVVEVTDWALLFLPWVASPKRSPLVVSFHGSCGQMDWFGKGEPRALDGDLVRMVEAAVLRGADVVHANSRANAEFWRVKTGREIRVIPPAYGGRNEKAEKLKSNLTTEEAIEHRGRWEKEQPQVGPKGERAGASESKCTESVVGPCLDKSSGAVFSNPFTSELAQDSEITSPTRAAIGPAGAICADDREIESVGGNQLADSAGFLESQSQAGLQINNQKDRTILEANDLRASGEYSASVLIREIRGQNSSSLATSHPLSAAAPQALKGLVVGRLQNLKGAEVLCKALRLAPEIEIEWAGGDTDWGSTGLKASEYLAANYPDVFGKRLRWIGRLEREKVAQKMKLAGFLVVPSLWDVFNLTVAEGLEAGLPVICSTAAGAEMLIEHGLSGFLFDSSKPEELASSLNLVAGLSANDRLEIAIRAQESVKIHLNEQRILKLLEDSYSETIKRGASKKNDLWMESLLSVGLEQQASPKSGFLRRAIRKVGRVLSNV
jgi:glycosyltransferase involved in cell wall biosynthesis